MLVCKNQFSLYLFFPFSIYPIFTPTNTVYKSSDPTICLGATAYTCQRLVLVHSSFKEFSVGTHPQEKK